MRRLSSTQRLFVNMVVVAAILLFGVWIYTSFINPEQTKAAWFNDSWSYRQAITVKENANTNVSSYPVKLTLSNLGSKAQSNCADLRVVNGRGKVIPSQIETCNTSGDTILWYQSDLNANEYQQFYVYYGNPSASALSFPTIDNQLSATASATTHQFTLQNNKTELMGDTDNASGAIRNLIDVPTGRDSAQTTSSSHRVDYHYEVNQGDAAGDRGSEQVLINGPIFKTIYWTESAGSYYTVYRKATLFANYPILYQDWSLKNTSGASHTYNSSHHSQTESQRCYDFLSNNLCDAASGDTQGGVSNTYSWFIDSSITVGMCKIRSASSTVGGNWRPGGNPNPALTLNDQQTSGWYEYYLRPITQSSDCTTYADIQYSKAPTITYASEEQSPGPVAYWKFDNNLLDSSGNNNTAASVISSSSTQKYAPGISGQAIDFTTDEWGTSLTWVNSNTLRDSSKSWTTNQWAGYEFITNYDATGGYCRTTIVSNTATDLTINGTCNSWSGGKTYRLKRTLYVRRAVNYGTQNITAEAWFKRTASKADTSNTLFRSSGNDMAIETYDTTISAYVINYTNAFTCTVDGKDNKWHHAALTYDGTTARLYYDGILCNSKAQTGSLDNNEYVVIGSRNDGFSSFFEGYIDEMKIYPYTRSTAQVQADYNSRGSVKGASTSIGNGQTSALTNGLVGYWKMDEASWNGTTGEVKDSSGNGNNGTSIASATTTSTAKFGNAAGFNGTSQYVNSGNMTSLNGLSQFTTSAWVYLNSTGTSDYDAVLARGDGTGSNRITMSIGGNAVGSRTSASVNIGNGANSYGYTATGLLTTGSWHLWTAVFDGTQSGNSNRLKFYFDGVQQPLTYVNTIPATTGTNTGNMLIGWEQASRFLDGNVDEVRIYNRALSSSEVAQLYAYAPDPVGYWDFENTGTSVVDKSGTGNTGTWTGSGGAKYMSGKYGSGGSFNDQNYVNIPDSSSVDISNSMTVSAWVYPTSSGLNGIVSKWYNNTTNNAYRFLLNSNSVIFYVSSDGSGTGGTAKGISSGANDVPYNKWSYVTGVFDASSGKGYIYVNGILKGTSSSFPSSIYNSSYSVNIGTGDNNFLVSNQAFTGGIDEVRLYNYARTPGQIISDMNASHPLGGSPDGSQVAYYRFDEGYGTVIHDSRPNSIDGSLSSSSLWTTDGVFGKAIKTNGSSTYASIPDNDAIDFAYNQDFTVSFWLKDGGGNATSDAIVEKWTGSGGYPYVFRASGNSLYFRRYDGTNNPGPSGTKVINDGQWHYIVGSKNGSTLSLYIDGSLNATATDTTTGTTTNSSAIYIGERGSGTQMWNGYIDEMKIYNTALTSDEIKTDYTHGSSLSMGALGTASDGKTPSNSTSRAYCVPGDTSTCTPPVGEWLFEEAQGTSVNDTSGNGYTGTLTNNPTWTAGKDGGGLKFNGTNSYVTTGDIDYGTNNSITIEAWVKFSSCSGNGGYCYIASKNKTINGTPYTLFVSPSNQLSFGVNNTQISSGANNADGQWHYVVGSITSTTASLYIDGAFVSSSTVTPISNDELLVIGGDDSDGTYRPWNGTIDNVKVYDYARTPAQIAWDYNQGKPIAYWRLDECQGTTLHDSAHNGNDGNIIIGSSGTQTSVGTCATSSTAWGNGASGRFNYSLNFDGTDDYVTMAQPNIPTSPNAFTVAGWIKPGAQDGFVITPQSNGIDQSIQYDVDLHRLVVAVTTSADTNNGAFYSTSNSVPANTWTHFAVSVDNRDVKIYINGKLNQSATHGFDIGGWTGTWYFGQRGNSTFWYSGQMDEVEIFPYVLNATQVKTLYNGNGAVTFGPAVGAP